MKPKGLFFSKTSIFIFQNRLNIKKNIILIVIIFSFIDNEPYL